jgi:hypothetical protein
VFVGSSVGRKNLAEALPATAPPFVPGAPFAPGVFDGSPALSVQATVMARRMRAGTCVRVITGVLQTDDPDAVSGASPPCDFARGRVPKKSLAES